VIALVSVGCADYVDEKVEEERSFDSSAVVLEMMEVEEAGLEMVLWLALVLQILLLQLRAVQLLASSSSSSSSW